MGCVAAVVGFCRVAKNSEHSLLKFQCFRNFNFTLILFKHHQSVTTCQTSLYFADFSIGACVPRLWWKSYTGIHVFFGTDNEKELFRWRKTFTNPDRFRNHCVAWRNYQRCTQVKWGGTTIFQTHGRDVVPIGALLAPKVRTKWGISSVKCEMRRKLLIYLLNWERSRLFTSTPSRHTKISDSCFVLELLIRMALWSAAPVHWWCHTFSKGIIDQ